MDGFEGAREEAKARTRSLLWNAVALLFGWTLFVYWWWVVLDHTNHRVFWHVVSGLAILVSFLVFFSLLWIIHNLRLARRSRRSQQTPYHSGTFLRDRLEREVVFVDLHGLREASIVVVHAKDDHKRYEEGRAEDLA